MKKLIAMLLVLALALVNVAVLAEDGTEATQDGTPTTATTFSTNGFKKVYSVTAPAQAEGTQTEGQTTESTAVYPAETLSFVVTVPSGYTNPDDTMITVSNYTPAGLEGYLTVNVPSYSKVGIYKYTITEETPTSPTQGVTYATNSVGLTVLVQFDPADVTHSTLEAVIGITKSGSDKPDTFTNTYGVGTLTVSKTVAGNAGKQNVYFDVTVKLTATNTVRSDITISGGSSSDNATTVAAGNGWTGDKEINLKIKHGETITFSDIPAGVTYTVTESDAHKADDPNGSNDLTGYTISYSNNTGTIAAGGEKAATITNTKEITVDTGVSLDYTPYMLIMTLTLVGVAMMVIRRREDY